MKVGLSLLYLELNRRRLEDWLEEKPTIGLYELVDNGTLAIRGDHLRKLKELVKSGFQFTVHGPYNGINIASLKEDERKESIRAHKESMEKASELNALCYVLHSGKVESEGKIEEHRKLNLESTYELLDFAKSIGLRVGVENGEPRAKHLLTLPSDFKGLDLEIVLDIGHAFLSSSLDEFLSLKDRIIEIHFHDNDGSFDAHLSLDEGAIPWRKVALEFKERNVLGIVESVYDPYESLKKLEKALL